jgi:hypothetical protein
MRCNFIKATEKCKPKLLDEDTKQLDEYEPEFVRNLKGLAENEYEFQLSKKRLAEAEYSIQFSEKPPRRE